MSSIRIPVDHMPDDICTLLDKNDYLYALLHPDGFQKGIFDVIHMNAKYPQWQNIIMHANKNDGIDNMIVVYTHDGWKVRSFSSIFQLLLTEYVLCFIHLEHNKDKMWPKNDTDVSDNDNIANICKILTTRTPEEKAFDQKMGTFANNVGRQIREILTEK